MKIKILTAGGTIDKVYFDAKSEYEVGPPQVVEILPRPTPWWTTPSNRS